MIFFVLNTFLVFELNEKFNFTYEHTRLYIIHAVFCLIGSICINLSLHMNKLTQLLTKNAHITTDLTFN